MTNKQKNDDLHSQRASRSKIDTRSLDSRATKITYWVLQSLIFANIILAILGFLFFDFGLGSFASALFICVGALVVFNIPRFFKKYVHLYIPTAIQIFVLVFIFAHFILGELTGRYESSGMFDKVLHLTSGLAIATIGFSVINLWNQSKNTHLQLSPFFVAFFAFAFALSVGVIWELFEFAMDSIFGSNMQRYIPPDALVQEVEPVQGYGLIDSMWDLLLSSISALIISILGYLVLKFKPSLLNKVLLRSVSNYDSAIEEATLSGDTELVKLLEQAKLKELGSTTDTDDTDTP